MKARLIESRDLAPSTRHFVFEADGSGELAYEPGQFVSLTAAIGGKTITRAYSVASAPQGNRFELCLNLVNEGRFSPLLFALETGGHVEFQGPLGYFTLRTSGGDAILVATGTGVAPFRGMLRKYAVPPSGRRFTLLFGARHQTGLLYREEFEQLAETNPNFSFRPTLSRPGEDWTGRTGHVQRHLDEVLDGAQAPEVYICGLKAMVDDVRTILKSKGLDRKQIVYEKYD